MFEEKVTVRDARNIAQDEVKALHTRLGRRLFGDMGKDCLNLYSRDWKTRDVGALGEIVGKQHDLENEIEKLKGEMASLKSSKKKKK